MSFVPALSAPTGGRRAEVGFRLVLVASDEQRPDGPATLIFAESRFDALAFDAYIAPHYGRALASARPSRRKKLATADALIAATAAACQLPLITRHRDLAEIDSVHAVIL